MTAIVGWPGKGAGLRRPDIYTKLLVRGSDPAVHDLCGNAVTLQGSAGRSTATTKFSNGSVSCITTSDYFTYPDSADWHVFLSDFTIEFFMMAPTVGISNGQIGQYESTSIYWRVYYDGTYLRLQGRVTAGFKFRYYAAATISNNVWYHVAIERSGSSCLMFLNGTKLSVTETTAFADMSDVASVLYVGNVGSTYYLRGYIDEVRISAGLARYTSNFTAPRKRY